MPSTRSASRLKTIFSCRNFAIGFAVIVAAVAITGIQLYKHHCFWWECAPQRSFTVYDLSLPGRLFPADARISGLDIDRGGHIFGEVEMERYYAWHGGMATYTVQRFASENLATALYEPKVYIAWAMDPLEDARPVAEVLNYHSRVAAESVTQCGTVEEDLECAYKARYAEFEVEFQSVIAENKMSPGDFLAVVEYVDSRFDELLK